MKTYNLMFAGVGGQGSLLIAELTSLAAVNAGYDTKQTEVHGVSQRGGSVETHVRFGEKVHSPIVTPGEADAVVGLEKLEALRFAHYLKCMVRDKVGSTMEQDQLQGWLQDWITLYVDGDPKHSSEATKATRPLAEAKVTVVPNEENPGYYSARFYLRPHYQLEGMDVGLSLVSRLPALKN
mgnify:CR=1 FL=1